MDSQTTSKLKLSIFLILSIFSVSGYSQQVSSIKVLGRVIDSTELGIPFAAIQFLDKNDSTTLYGTISNENGIFSIDSVKPSSYFVKVTSIGFKTNYRTLVLSEKKKEIYLKLFKLYRDPFQLDEIEIKGKASGYYELADKTVFYPDSISLQSTRNGLDLINKLPEIQVNKRDGAIRVLGNSNVLVLINGVNNNRTLKAINPNDIERIELITHPSAKYRSDIVSVVNVVLKDNRKQGVSVYSDISVCVNQRNHFAFAQIGYSFNKWQFFINYRGFISQDISKDTTTRTEQSDINQFEYYSFPLEDAIFNGNHHRIQYGIDFIPNKKTIFNFTGQIYFFKAYFNSKTKMQTKKNESLLRSSINTTTSNTNNTQQNYTLYFRKEFIKHNEISWNTNLYLLNDMGVSNYSDTSQYTSPPADIISTRDELSSFHQYSINSRIDYSQSISEQIKFETGYQYYGRSINTDVESFGVHTFLYYSDNRNSIYGNIIFEFQKLGIQSGLRLENLNIRLYDTLKNNYLKWLPSIDFLFKLKPGHNIRLSYNQKLKYPSYYRLNPYEYFSSDSLSSGSGNPYLLPETSHVINATYSFKRKSFNTSLSLEYRSVVDIIAEKISTENNIFKTKYENLGRANQFGLKFNIYTFLFNFVEIESYLYISYNSFPDRSEYNGLAYNSGISSYIPLPWDIDLELSFIFASKEINYNGWSIENAMIDEISISKNILKNNGTIGISVWEPFLRSRYREKIWTPTTVEKNNGEVLNNTSFMINFSYFLKAGRKIEKSKKVLYMENNERN